MTNDANNRNGRGNREKRNADSRFVIRKMSNRIFSDSIQ